MWGRHPSLETQKISAAIRLARTGAFGPAWPAELT
jgi:hypothetical protein